MSRFEPNPASGRGPVVNLPMPVWALAIVLLAIHGLAEAAPADVANWLFERLALVTTAPQRWWTFLTYAALHADWLHVGSNVLWLVIFSKPVHMQLGTGRYLALFALSVVAGGAAAVLAARGQEQVLVGASAGVSGLLGAAIPLMYGTPSPLYASVEPLRPLGIITDRRALVFTLMWLGLTLVTASAQALGGKDILTQHQVAWQAHLGGFFAGLILFYVLDYSVKRIPLHTLH